MPQVSVIIPTYNGSRFICQTVESVFRQSYPDYEVIVVDDGSSDQTGEVLEPYLDRIRYYHQPNQGVAAARNFGLEVARGNYINFLDHDDWLLPQKLALQVDIFEKQPSVGMVHSGWRRVNQWGESLTDIEPWHESPKLDLLEWLQRMPILLSAMLLRREWVEEAGGFDTGFKQACDVDLIQHLALIGCQTAWVHQVTTCYRQHSKNDSLNTLVQAKESWEVRQKFFARTDLPSQVREQKNQYLYHTLVWIAWRLYYTHHFEKMGETLQQSLHYSPYPYLETVLNWIDIFQELASKHESQIDVESLTRSTEWKQLLEVARQEASKKASNNYDELALYKS